MRAPQGWRLGASGAKLSPMLKKTGAALIADKVKTLPSATGVYRMIGQRGAILYIGKARNLKKRVQQYTKLSRQSARIARMITLTREMEFTLTPSEPEALLLEARMIKRHRPPFNIIFRDDKSFPFIELNHDHEAARLSKYREQPGRKRRARCEYFGPFVSADAVDRTLIALQRAFLLRSCTDHVYAHRARPCLLYQIKRCAAPCTGEISLKAYRQLADQAREFLRGASRDVQKNLTRQMDKAADAQHYEIAALYRDRLRALQQIQTQPGRYLSESMNADLFAIHHEGRASCIQLFVIRSGQNLGNHAWFPKHHAQDETWAILESFIAQFYTHRQAAPLIITNLALPSADLLAEALTLRAQRNVKLVCPQRGAKKNLIANAAWNARAALARHHAEIANQKDMLKQLAKKLKLQKPIKRIEIYDNSHIQGHAPVGAMVVAGEEGFMKAHYRMFNIKAEALKAGDDYAMMRQVFARRFRKKDAAAIVPDLIIIDGGLGQMSAVADIIAALGKDAPRRDAPRRDAPRL